ncbi:hypothetical protein MYSE111917_25275 [Mycobacterium senriense]
MSLRVVLEGLTVVYTTGAAIAAASYLVGAGGR